MGGVNGAEKGTESRDERIESYYHESARDLATWLVDAEDDLTACVSVDDDRIAELNALDNEVRRLHVEIERLNNLVHAENGRADFNQDEAQEYQRLNRHASDLYEMFRRKYDDEHDRAERLRLAWLSARRRAARESEYAAEALTLKDAEIARLLDAG
jgi:TolA-binding protein